MLCCSGERYRAIMALLFLNFCLRKYFLVFFAEFELWMLHNTIVKISEKNEQAELVENLLPIYLPCKGFLHNLHSFLIWEKVKIFDFLKIND